MSSGNISIKLSQVTLQDNQNTYLAFATLFGENGISGSETRCNATLLVAARFLTPSVTVNETNMNVTCSTQGGYPKPTVTWTIHDVLWAQKRTLDPHEVQTNFTLDPESGLYTVWSQVNSTENQTVTCHIFNPVLKETVSNTAVVGLSQSIHTDPTGDVQEGLSAGLIGVIISILITFIFGVIYFVFKYCHGARGGATGASRVATGASGVATGASGVATGASRVATGASGVATGASRVATGASRVATGASRVATGGDEELSILMGSTTSQPQDNGSVDQVDGATVTNANGAAANRAEGVTEPVDDTAGGSWSTPGE
ncbi:hypothetical protein J4Q44_G00194220 [Coregonus suidteri]|uniref:Ig-like domain-containing protein n=2 Tax=Coregonus TaxID=27772 RepID=A0AAN8LWV2_9TELE